VQSRGCASSGDRGRRAERSVVICVNRIRKTMHFGWLPTVREHHRHTAATGVEGRPSAIPRPRSYTYGVSRWRARSSRPNTAISGHPGRPRRLEHTTQLSFTYSYTANGSRKAHVLPPPQTTLAATTRATHRPAQTTRLDTRDTPGRSSALSADAAPLPSPRRSRGRPGHSRRRPGAGRRLRATIRARATRTGGAGRR